MFSPAFRRALVGFGCSARCMSFRRGLDLVAPRPSPGNQLDLIVMGKRCLRKRELHGLLQSRVPTSPRTVAGIAAIAKYPTEGPPGRSTPLSDRERDSISGKESVSSARRMVPPSCAGRP